mmetsp:Transcript_37442/g.107216  ORF Transcript_37442/g.107216 Transcript_37442/m.107216 type:complete len:363 (+) Transcript_37442:347-1435(+)
MAEARVAARATQLPLQEVAMVAAWARVALPAAALAPLGSLGVKARATWRGVCSAEYQTPTSGSQSQASTDAPLCLAVLRAAALGLPPLLAHAEAALQTRTARHMAALQARTGAAPQAHTAFHMAMLLARTGGTPWIHTVHRAAPSAHTEGHPLTRTTPHTAAPQARAGVNLLTHSAHHLATLRFTTEKRPATRTVHRRPTFRALAGGEPQTCLTRLAAMLWARAEVAFQSCTANRGAATLWIHIFALPWTPQVHHQWGSVGQLDRRLPSAALACPTTLTAVAASVRAAISEGLVFASPAGACCTWGAHSGRGRAIQHDQKHQRSIQSFANATHYRVISRKFFRSLSPWRSGAKEPRNQDQGS